MIITCDSSVNMGYIYLQKPHNYLKLRREREGDLISYAENLEYHQIPFVQDESVLDKLLHLKQSPKIYSHAYRDGEFFHEYQSDLDSEGYVTGIEISLRKESFLTLLQKNSFRCYSFSWDDNSMRLFTLEEEDIVFNSQNILYPLHWNRDSFLIIDIDPISRMGRIRGLLTSNEDRYPSLYLLQPLFFLK
ncbi:hypothetical protein [Thermoactinomyces sp. DSM 45892]|uniref:hypothetical protein n=1 Tax=Thermoactinomyces sp. DSM 45892 TaxID=1882753 RepID=UPI00089792DA|nr:hypothetical protein [Thermoactinomyces sp. DSM 45892]SDY12049.1 hypothetical protein SAMN05444416_10259 [Thermoactinomyces sp. DSM 45892]